MIFLAIGLYLAGAAMTASYALSHGPTEEWIDVFILFTCLVLWPFMGLPMLVLTLAENRRIATRRRRSST